MGSKDETFKNYYMGLPDDRAGSMAKNRFQVELLWGIKKIIELHKKSEEYAVIFDFKCDIEVHKNDEIEFYQIKSKKSGNYTPKTLLSKGQKKHSILGTLYGLYNSNHKMKLAIVCNMPLKVKEKIIDVEEKNLVYLIKKQLKR